MRRIVTAAVALALVAGIAHAENAHHGRGRPQQPAKRSFGPGFPVLYDREWDTPEQRFPIGGFGGVTANAPHNHIPIIFVHGNNVDAADWYPVVDEFRAAYPPGDPKAYTDQDLWALSYNGIGGINGTALFTQNPRRDQEKIDMVWDGTTRVTANDVNVPDLYDFIEAVRSYTGSARFSIVAHSLGVTLARKTLQLHWDEFRDDLVAFVGIAGGNHGTSFCPPGSEDQLESCDEIAANTPWLANLNVDPDGSAHETYGTTARWMTVYDGTGTLDIAFVGPAYAQSPRLNGAVNCEFPFTYHNDLRLDPAIVAVYRTFLEHAEDGTLGACAA